MGELMPIDWQEMYDQIGRAYISWFIRAQSLKSSADIIWREIEHTLYNERGFPYHHNTVEDQVEELYLMLIGMSIENALKALYVINNPELVTNGKMNPKWKDGHDLVKLAELSGYVCNEINIDLLRNLSGYIKWAGRYPIPQKVSPDPIKDYPMILLPIQKVRIDLLLKGIFSKVEEASQDDKK